MKLWIRPQNKEALLICEKLFINEEFDHKTLLDADISADIAYDKTIEKSYNYGANTVARIFAKEARAKILCKSQMSYIISCEHCILGEYKSKKEAMQILDDIESALKVSENVIYQMPKY